MAHILILEDWEALLEQMHNYSFTVQSNISNDLYHGKDNQDAEALMASVETLINVIDTEHRTALDAKIADLEAFLGI